MRVLSIGMARRFGAVAVIGVLGLMVLMAPDSLASAGQGPRALARAAQAAAAPPYGLSRHIYALMMAQIPLDKAANQIQLAAAEPGAGHQGFFETQVNDARHVLTVVWHGGVPADIRHVIARLRGRVHIRMIQARYSFARLEQVISRAKRADPAVTGGYPLSNGGGVHLDVRAAAHAQTAAVIEARFGVPVVAVPSGIAVPQVCRPNPNDTLGPGSRCWDLPAFWGGDAIISQYGNWCTGGFGVRDGRGNTYMMTAAHCATRNGVTFTNGNNTATLGAIGGVLGLHDGAIIPTSTGDRYYDGPGIPAGDTTRTKFVSGQQGVSRGDVLCVSGSNAGVICGMQVTAVGYQPPGYAFRDLALATSLGGRYTFGGDSGGPWFSLNGSTSVWAKGIHSGITRDSHGNTNGELFTPISILSQDMGVFVNP